MPEYKNISNYPECPLCGAEPELTKVKEVRGKAVGGRWYRIRRYRCTLGHPYSTEETYKNVSMLYVQKRDGCQLEFSFGNVMNSIQCAAADEISIKECKEISHAIMRSLSEKIPTVKNNGGIKGRGKIFLSSEVGELVLKFLFDQGYHKAWVRFALVFYKSELGKSPNYTKIRSVLNSKATNLLGDE